MTTKFGPQAAYGGHWQSRHIGGLLEQGLPQPGQVGLHETNLLAELVKLPGREFDSQAASFSSIIPLPCGNRLGKSYVLIRLRIFSETIG